MHSTSTAYEIDHVFICTSAGGPEAEQLIAFGLTEGSRNHHPGQGTANRRFFFENAMLELLWVENSEEARSEEICRLGLWERWSQRALGASPFGICYRPTKDPSEPPPFESWTYRPPYAPITLAVSVTSPNSHQPLLFYLPYLRKANRDEPCIHAKNIRNLSSVVISGPIMELIFDGGVQKMRHDFHPHLPLTLFW
jgi:Glyoxalase-like domain